MGRHYFANTVLIVLLLLTLLASLPGTASAAQAAQSSSPAALTTTLTTTVAVAPPEGTKVVLGDTSIDGPALWTSNPSAPRLGLAGVLAWTGTDPAHSLNIMQSGDGITYGGKVTFSESSASRPAVAAQSGSPSAIVLAWTGLDGNHSLNLLCQGPACGTTGSNYKKVTFGDNSFTSPALARFGNGFVLAWAGTDANHSLNVWPFSITSSGSGFQMGTKTVLSQFSSVSQPSLATNPQNNQLLLTWDATTPANHLAFATSSNGTTWSAYGLMATSAAGPSGFALASATQPTYWMSWAGTDAAQSVSVRFTQTFPTWPPSNISTLPETALGGPVLGNVGDRGQMLLAWTGTDTAHHLNIATLTAPGTPTLDQRIDTYIASLSTTQLIGQTLMMSVCASSLTSDLNQALTQWDVGSAIIYTSCNGGPTQPPTATSLQQLDQAMQNAANPKGSLLLAIDQEGGTVDRLAPYYGTTPSAQQLTATGNPQAAYAQAQTDARRMRNLGLNVDLAPVVDVYQGGGEGSSRMFGTTAGTVTTYGGAFLAGLQQNGIAGSLKHWPGLGAASGNPDDTLPTITRTQAQLNATDFAPFRSLLYQAPGMIMPTTVMVPAYDAQNPAMLSPTLVGNVLRGQLGYQGVIVTDSLGGQGLITYMQQQGYSDSTKGIAEASVRAFLVGDDLLLCPVASADLPPIVTAMAQAVQSGRISTAQLHAAVHRIIRLKVELGLIAL